MFKYFNKKSSIIIIFATIFLILESFVAIIETDFVRALMNWAVYPDPNNIFSTKYVNSRNIDKSTY